MNAHPPFPDDENGQVLATMAERGDRLDQPREIDFSVIFPSEDQALAFAITLLRGGAKVSFSEYEENPELSWEVTVHPVMVPRHGDITAFEAMLAAEAEPLGGRNDGWGCGLVL
ncbi:MULTISPECIES: ribonuclease E inhibitor RraB [Dyella]|uniref:Ribonuclease E inhibitor RraB n=2 Tax=Dyella TaxID=231454 RepID=A0A4V2NMG4_9GAMM|nr:MULTISPECIES: ribonuclease E inhibitor RraB [Dyella]TBR39257.1 ribonuclease E inhibitor RraB [Dyella terrae]TCI13157.1 ribonuclease E inhibitor RraB [Dyella soli]